MASSRKRRKTRDGAVDVSSEEEGMDPAQAAAALAGAMPSVGSGAAGENSESEGEDLQDAADLNQDYRAIPELDRYDAEALDDRGA